MCSTAFVGVVGALARAAGFPDFPVAVIQHPLSTRTPEEVRLMAAQCAEQIARLASGPEL